MTSGANGVECYYSTALDDPTRSVHRLRIRRVVSPIAITSMLVERPYSCKDFMADQKS